MHVETQVPLPVIYDGQHIDAGYKLDLVVDGVIIVELKAVPRMHHVFDAQLLSYLRLSNDSIGLLINFHVPRLKDGIKRFANL